jgi:hypothetical protein
MKTKTLIRLIALLAASGGAVDATTFNFTNVLDNTGAFDVFYHCAAINNAGVVAFNGQLKSGVRGIYRTDGSTITTIVDTSTNEFSFNPVPRNLESRPAIDDDGTVAFFIYHRVSDWNYAPSVRTGSGGTTVLIAESSTDGTFFDAFSNPAIRNGVVSFRGGLNAPPENPWGIFTVPAGGGSYTVIAQDGGKFTDAFGESSINASGQVAYYGDLTNGVSGIFAGPDGATIIAQTGGDSPFYSLDVFPKISDGGLVVFHAELTNYNYGNFIGSGGAVTQITVAGGGEVDGVFPSVNSAGMVACFGRLASGEKAVLAGTGAVVEKVIAVGDALFGSTVYGLEEPGSHGLNNNGQMVFTYSLENGVEGIAIATPANGSAVVRPELNIQRIDPLHIRLAWPTNTTGFLLKYATNLPATNWMPALPLPVVANGENVVTNAFTGGAVFYRLQKP